MQKMTTPIVQDDINMLEVELALDFPSTYIDFLLKYNGGRPTPNSFDFYDKSDASCVNLFFGITDIDYMSLRDAIATFYGRIPSGFLPIACDPGGNLLVLDCTNNKSGIFFWDHELEADDEDQPSMENISFIAKDIDDLLNQFYSIEI